MDSFVLRSRGLPRQSDKRMLVYSDCETVLDLRSLRFVMPSSGASCDSIFSISRWVFRDIGHIIV